MPSYVANAIPIHLRIGSVYKNTAPTYAGIFRGLSSGKMRACPFLEARFPAASAGIVALVLSALVCHALFYLVPGLLGMKTVCRCTSWALRLRTKGFYHAGFLMVSAIWLVSGNIYFSSLALGIDSERSPQTIMIVWGVLAAFMD